MVREDKAIVDREMGFLKASQIFSLRKATFQDYAKSRGKKAKAIVTLRLGRRSVLPVQTGN
jgi:predicted nucleic-acid-binding protein